MWQSIKSETKRIRGAAVGLGLCALGTAFRLSCIENPHEPLARLQTPKPLASDVTNSYPIATQPFHSSKALETKVVHSNNIFNPAECQEVVSAAVRATMSWHDAMDRYTNNVVGFLTGSEMLAVSNALERLYGHYTNQLHTHIAVTNGISGNREAKTPLTAEEYAHAIAMLEARAEIATLYINGQPQHAKLLFDNSVRSTTSFGPRMIFEGCNRLIAGSRWLNENYPKDR